MTHPEAVAYCRWLSEEIGEAVRLPTSREWEWAARGPEESVFRWGDSFEEGRCSSLEAGVGTTTAVDAYPDGAGSFGLLDQAGNVWEWCADDDENGWAALKGGCWLDAAWGVRPERTLTSDPSRAAPTVGFRVAV